MKNNNEVHKAFLLGISRQLMWGYVAIAIFMIGSGLEQAFLSKQLIEMGFLANQAAFIFTIYGVAVAIAAWLSAILAELFGAKKIMVFGTITWLVFQIGFILFGIIPENYLMIVLMYGLRGFSFPLFVYAFISLITQTTPMKQLPGAMGGFWFAYSLGLGVFGSYLPSVTIPKVGYIGTLWLAVLFVGLGGLISVFGLKNVRTFDHCQIEEESKEPFKDSITILFRKPKIFLAAIVKMINQLAANGYVIAMPLFLTSHKIGFTMSEWLQIWGLMYLVNIAFNLIWGMVANHLPWHRVVEWFGCVGMALACVLFYYVPYLYGPNVIAMFGVAALFGAALAAFTPISAIFVALAPEETGAAMSIHNLAGGLSQFVGYGVTGVLLSLFDTAGFVWSMAGIYLIGAICAHFLAVRE
ncbi:MULTISPECIES: MFS transporter [Carnobacterium]|uniref:MFS transporter n=1 Tax=Carnobacterium TaxID=2747 RepID=UPI0028900CC9|nr:MULTISPECIES: MFS transporter [Carnobacterium]MDT1940567.1 MFS transporter [Carnobacterium divergens]MDT1943005.1 MFS transporter [Carnobacterium divergens]MDT1948812.1 MFS transporter [Carnobacterium divergens]MDT1951292.1 MFS transporter [Carnobacterium divergens]MDT1956350.1 MFS transporter [Carnobacterium divergens]